MKKNRISHRDVDPYVLKSFAAFCRTLDEAERQVVDWYKANDNDDAGTMNKGLMTSSSTAFADKIEILDRLMQRFEPPPFLQVFRASSEAMVLPYIKRTVFSPPYFISTSSTPTGLSSHFIHDEPVYLAFCCFGNTQMISLECNPEYSESENEILLARNSSFTVVENRVTREQDEKEFYMDYRSRQVHKLRIIVLSSR